jgi:hypothetical protein
MVRRMRWICLLPALVLAPLAARAADDAAAAFCRTNPAFSFQVIREVLDAQLAKDHDPALDELPPDQMALRTVEQGVSDCAAALRQDPGALQTMTSLQGSDLAAAWDAWNTTCDDRPHSKADCVKAEMGAMWALKRMSRTNQPPGAHALVEACQLVMANNPAMTEWRECVDAGLAVHASDDAAKRCKTSVNWHVAKTGAEAGKMISECLRGGPG